MKYFFLSTAFAIQSLLTFAQSETRTIEPFTGIDVGESITVYLTKGSSNEARIETSGVNTDKVLLDNYGDRLRIHMKSGSWRSFNAEVYLEFEEIEEISVSSSADLITKSTIKGERLEVDVSSSGRAKLDIDINRLDADVSSSGKLDIRGSADKMRVGVNSSGKFYGYDLQANYARVDASSSGKAEINASTELEAEANSAGRIRYQGNPDKLYVSSNSGGTIRKE